MIDAGLVDAGLIDVRHPLVHVSDWVVAATLIGSAVMAWRRSRPVALLLLIGATSWLVGGLLAPAVLWHRAVLVHLLLAYPAWRPPDRPAVAVVVTTYLACVLAPVVLQTEPGTVVSAVLVPAAAAWSVRRTDGLARHLRRTALLASGLLAAGLLVGSALRLLGGAELVGSSVLVYDVAVALTVVTLVIGLRPPEQVAVADLVIDLGESRAAALRDALATVLRDPGLVLGYWDPEAHAHVDGAGRAVDGTRPGRVAVPIERHGRPFALLQLDGHLARDPQVVASIRLATRVVTVNDRRQDDLLAQVHELQASRRRLVAVGDEERRRLERELEVGIMRRLAGLAERLRATTGGTGPPEPDGVGAAPAEGEPDETPTHLQRAVQHLERTVGDLREIATGLRPGELAGGLGRALEQLAERSPVPTTVRGAGTACATGLPEDVELAVWYLCAEALSNCARHAPHARVRITLSRSAEALRVQVADDGPGGAVAREGGGLLGLRDRVGSVGGRLSISSGREGTVLDAELPLV